MSSNIDPATKQQQQSPDPNPQQSTSVAPTPKSAHPQKTVNGHDPSPKGQAHKSQNGNQTSATPKSSAVPDPEQAVSPTLRKHVEQLVAATEVHVKGVNGRLEHVEQLDDSELKRYRDVLVENRADLQTLIIELPTGGKLQQRVSQASDEVTLVLNRVDAVTRAHTGRVATSGDAIAENKAIAFREASEKVPLGYCDTAPSQVAPCELDSSQRETYRQYVRDSAHAMHISWVAAINAVKVEEKMKKDEVPFAQVLGELLLAILTDGVSLGVKAVVSKGLGRVEKAMTKVEMPGYGEVPAVTSAPDMRVANWIGSEVADKGTRKGIEKLREHNGAMNGAQFAVASKEALQVPDTRDAFLQFMKSAPSQWASNITTNVNKLFDADLAALVAGLPDPKTIDQPLYEGKIRALLKKYDEQVLAIKIAPTMSDATAIMVALPNGMIRHALVTSEEQPDPKLHGEWKNSLVKTGKKSFVRWIDDDMQEMAVARSVAKAKSASAAGEVKWALDATYWDEASLATFKGGPNTEETPEP
jgi:hypothetical protein